VTGSLIESNTASCSSCDLEPASAGGGAMALKSCIGYETIEAMLQDVEFTTQLLVVLLVLS